MTPEKVYHGKYRMSHGRLVARLQRFGWRVTGWGYNYTHIEDPKTGRHGEIPWANKPMKPWDTYTWDRMKKALRLAPEEVRG